MPQSDDTATATKQDIRMIMEMIGVFMDETRGLIAESEQRTRVEIQASEERMKAEFHAAKDEIKDFFSTGIEIVREEVVGANADKLSQHQDRLDDHDQRLVALEGASAR